MVSWAVLIGAFWIALSALVCAPQAAASDPDRPDCTRRAGDGKTGSEVKPTVKLAPDTAANVVNFGGSRGVQYVDVVLNATPALPQSLQADEVRLEVLHRFSRTSDKLRTTSAPPPTFTEPRISAARNRITFTMCLDGSGLDAGSYAGSILVEGPKGLAPTSISVTENAKNLYLAGGGAVAVLALAFVFLVIRGAAARQLKTEERLVGDVANTETESGLGEALNKQRQHQPEPVRSYVLDVFKDLNWWVTSIVALALAAGSIYGLYSADPSWGADTVGSVIALVGPAFTAVGVQSVVTSLGRPVTR